MRYERWDFINDTFLCQAIYICSSFKYTRKTPKLLCSMITIILRVLLEFEGWERKNYKVKYRYLVYFLGV